MRQRCALGIVCATVYRPGVRGLACPENMTINRRQLFGRAASAAATIVVSQSIFACSADATGLDDDGSTDTITPGSASASCILTASLTEGPHFVDERLQRSDIRADPTTGALSAGTPPIHLAGNSFAAIRSPMRAESRSSRRCTRVGTPAARCTSTSSFACSPVRRERTSSRRSSSSTKR